MPRNSAPQYTPRKLKIYQPKLDFVGEVAGIVICSAIVNACQEILSRYFGKTVAIERQQNPSESNNVLIVMDTAMSPNRDMTLLKHCDET